MKMVEGSSSEEDLTTKRRMGKAARDELESVDPCENAAARNMRLARQKRAKKEKDIIKDDSRPESEQDEVVREIDKYQKKRKQNKKRQKEDEDDDEMEQELEKELGQEQKLEDLIDTDEKQIRRKPTVRLAENRSDFKDGTLKT